MSFHWWRNPGATYIACLLAIILIGVGQSWTLKDELSTAQLLERDIIQLNEQMHQDLTRWQEERQWEQEMIGDERLAHQAFRGWVMETFPALQQAERIDQLSQRLTTLETQGMP